MSTRAEPTRRAAKRRSEAGNAREEEARRNRESKRRGPDERDLLVLSSQFAGNAATSWLARRVQARVPANAMGGNLVDRLYAGRTASATPIMRAKVKHRTGKQVDAYASSHTFLKSYVASKIKSGTKAEGAVNIHAAAAFKKEWVKYAMSRLNPDTGKKYTKKEAEADEPNINAFRDGPKIHIHEERGEPGTAIHESMHLYSHDDYRGTLGANANEGATEYFTRLLTSANKIKRGTFYPSQLASTKKLVAASSKKDLANAYFNGKLKGLKDDVEAKTKGGWAKWKDYMKKGKYSDADALL